MQCEAQPLSLHFSPYTIHQKAPDADAVQSAPEVDLEALGLELAAAVLAGDLVGLHVAAVLALDDAVRCQHDVGARQLSSIRRPLAAVKHHHLTYTKPLSTPSYCNLALDHVI